MEIDPRSSADLAVFFAKRFPQAEQRDALAAEAHVRFREPPTDDPDVAWGGLLTRAQEQAALERLARCAARRMPDDENLQGVSAVLNGRTWPPELTEGSPSWHRQAAVMAALVLLAAGAMWMVPGDDDALVAAVHEDAPAALTTAQPAPDVEATPPVETVPVATEGNNAPPADEPPAAQVDAVATSGAAAPPSPEDDAEETDSADGTGSATTGDAGSEASPAAAAEPPTQLPGCRGAPGELVGYWYAGPTAPGKAGDRITVPRDLNVRADYPDQHNNFNARAQVRCTLGEGADLVLTADPIAVPGGAYWVPLHTPSPRS